MLFRNVGSYLPGHTAEDALIRNEDRKEIKGNVIEF
jgi:hypothetical protein